MKTGPMHWRLSGVALVMGIFAFLGVGGVMFVHQLTYDRIQMNLRQDTLSAMHRLLPANEYDNDLLANPVKFDTAGMSIDNQSIVAHRATMQHRPVATLFSLTAPDGYNGDINLLVVVRENGMLAGVEVIGHRETPGLGDKIESSRSDWLQQFVGASLVNPPQTAWRVKRDGGHFDQLTGATVTPRAIVKAVQQVLAYLRDHGNDHFKIETDPITSTERIKLEDDRAS
ncbi:MAG: electron transport complex subunit RsxG [Candidatus Thiodiazotropha sp. (ex Myrtea sp. 'scaly one' KF741663)]|nr:electron transport complex subunit RsxG [Candidatus Thiodiazotropha sp. (ex Myrtea sp. 'scaly one' KF741663)]